MRIGYAQKSITPDWSRPVFLAGFDQNRRATGLHDDLYARALAVSDGEYTLVLCALDLIGFIHKDVAEVIERVKTQYPQAEIVIAATHTHHGPDTLGIWGPDEKTSGLDPSYMAALKDKVTAAILASLRLDLVAGSLKSGCAAVPSVVKNARDPEIIDDQLTCLQWLSPAEEPLVTVFGNFSCHPEVLFDTNTQITSDYPGVLRREVETATGAPCIFLAGSLGGMMTPEVSEHTFEAAEDMGRKLAVEGLKVLASAQSVSEFALGFKRVTFTTRLTNILFKIAIRRGLLPETRDRRGRVNAETNLIQFGSTWLVTVPGELLPKLGLEIKAMMMDSGAGCTGVIGLGNDELGYILPKEDFRYPLNPLKPGSHYEETMSIGKTIGPRLMAAVAELLS